MKKIFTIAGLFLLGLSSRSGAQSFDIQHHDTIKIYNPTSTIDVHNDIENLTTSGIKLEWKIIASNFTNEYIGATSFCDNALCYPSSDVFPIGTMQTSLNYAPGPNGIFKLMYNPAFPGLQNGTYYVTIRLNNQAIPTDTARTTFVIYKSPASVSMMKSTDEVVLYPNPATSALNVIYSASADVKSIAVYNIIGKAITVYKTTDPSSANLNLENLPGGVYFVRLMNSHGETVATRKFTKQ